MFFKGVEEATKQYCWLYSITVNHGVPLCFIDPTTCILIKLLETICYYVGFKEGAFSCFELC